MSEEKKVGFEGADSSSVEDQPSPEPVKVVDEVAELNAITVDPSLLQTQYRQFSVDTTEAFARILALARELNTSVQPPEIVLIGKQGAGKSLLVEALIGHPLGAVKETLRPTLLQISNNASAEKPKISFKSEKSDSMIVSKSDSTGSLLRTASEVSIKLPQVAEEVNRRSPSLNPAPLIIKYEWSHAGNVTIIDTPGLVSSVPSFGSSASSDSASYTSDGESSEKKENRDPSKEREKIVMEWAKAAHRLLVFVEQADDWESVEMIEYAKKKLDVKLSRSVFIFTHLNKQLSKFANPRDLQQFFQRRPMEAKCFFVTLFSEKVRSGISGNDFDELSSKFQNRIAQAYKRDQMLLSELKIDKRYDELVGIGNIRTSVILENSWRAFKECQPELRKQLALSKKLTNDALKRQQDQRQGLDIGKMRSIISNYVADWLQCVVALSDGSNEGNPSLNGQTLSEENAYFESLEWTDERKKHLMVDASEEILEIVSQDVKNSDTRMYGAIQLERSLTLLRLLVKQKEWWTITEEEREVAAAVTHLNRSDLTLNPAVASAVIQGRMKAWESKVIEPICQRAAASSKRLAEIAFSVMSQRSQGARRMQSNQRTILDEMQHLSGFQYFKSIIRDIYYDYIDKLMKQCREKCNNELETVQLVYWESGKTAVAGKSELDVTNQLMSEISEAICTNICLKCHQHFVVLLQRDLSGEILKDISSFNDKMLQQVFEMEKLKQLLQVEEEKHKLNLQDLSEKEVQLRDLSVQFSRFSVGK